MRHATSLDILSRRIRRHIDRHERAKRLGISRRTSQARLCLAMDNGSAAIGEPLFLPLGSSFAAMVAEMSA